MSPGRHELRTERPEGHHLANSEIAFMPQSPQRDRPSLDLSRIDDAVVSPSLPREFYFYATWGVLLIIMSVISLPFQRLGD
ncbi:hypothetical protein SAMN05216382_3041 [Sphingomonas palmae]|uniref:Uncharacterized protein n=2 Tax=Sphingomonas palmae TaxID=1855283 RepID=A0A1H7UN35_9SPHN|nr:hypothetical protein SAMN05216382_3041 [Sphingomonas palmae]